MQTCEALIVHAESQPRYDLFSDYGVGGLTWQDVKDALDGVDLTRSAMALYLLTGDAKCRSYFWAGLFMEVMRIPDLGRRPDLLQPGDIENLCHLAVREWGDGVQYSTGWRSKLLNVSRGTWYRKFADAYPTVYEIPERWHGDLAMLLKQRLR